MPGVPDAQPILGQAVSVNGRGYARVQSGARYFLAKGPVPGDRLSFVPPEQGHTLKEWELVQGAHGRRNPPCVVAALCGGCRLMCLGETAQHAIQRDRVRNALLSQGVDWTLLPHEMETGSALRYRNRIRLQVNSVGALRFFNPNKAISCAVLEPELATRVVELTARVFSGMSEALFVEVRSRDLDGQFGVHIVPNRQQSGGTAEWAKIRAELGSEHVVGVEGEGEPPVQRFSLTEGLFFYAPLGSFMQVNSAMNARLVAWVTERVLETGAGVFWDLFSGVGNFSLPLLKLGLRGLGVEIDPHAVAAAARGSHEQGLKGRFIAADVGSWLQQSQSELPDVVIVDAPRAGAQAALSVIAQVAQKCVLMVSCCPETLARDIGILERGGWMLTCMRMFDMFPQTHHIEVVAELVRAPRV